MTGLEILSGAIEGFHVEQKQRAARLDTPFAKQPSLLYFIGMDGPDRFVKIGIASDIITRLSSAQANCPYPLQILKTIEGAWHLEKSLHKRFSHLHVRGEWFRLAEDLEDLIDKLS